MSKPIDWRGSSLSDLRDFPDDAKRNAGYQLRQLQEGEQPEVFKSMSEVGAGVYEIIVDVIEGWFRVLYVAKFEEAIYVLHSFQKKTNTTPDSDKKLAKFRYAAVIQERRARTKRGKS